jgi:hypothetical protein
MNRQQSTDRQHGVKTRKGYVPVMWNLWILAYTSLMCSDVMMHGYIIKFEFTFHYSAVVRLYVLEMRIACLSVVAPGGQQQPICSPGIIPYCFCYINKDG